MKIEDKAADSPEVDLARQSAPGVYMLESKELKTADEVTPEGEFPEYGDFLPVRRAVGTGDDASWSETTKFIECPSGLARELVDLEISTGDGFRIVSLQKVDSEWRYEIERMELDE